MVQKKTPVGLFCDVLIYVFLGIFTFLCLYPFWYLVIYTFSDPTQSATGVSIWFKGFSLYNVQQVLRLEGIGRALLNSVLRTVLGTAITVVCCSFLGYLFTKEEMPAKKLLYRTLIVTMYVSGGLIPTYMLYMEMKLIRTYWVMVLPYGLSITYFIIMRNYFSYSVPRELEDAARIDGCNDVRVFFQVILPLSKPMLAAVSLFIAVGFWNDYYSYMMYIATKPTLQPFAWVLRRVLTDSAMMSQMRTGAVDIGAQLPPPMALRMATIICAMLPIMCVYPFLQKHFAKGVLIGAVKE